MSYGELDDRDFSLLRHIARYQLTFKEIVRQVVFGGADPDRVLGGLKTYGFIEARKGYGGNRVAYTLLKRGAKAIGAGRRKGEAPGTESEATHLAVLCFCFLKMRPRARVEPDELSEVFGDLKLPGRHHVLEYGARAKRIYRVYAPGPTTAPEEVSRQARIAVSAMRSLPGLEPWLANGVYALAILVNETERAARIAARLDEERIDGAYLRDVAEVLVEVVPGRDQLEDDLRVLA